MDEEDREYENELQEEQIEEARRGGEAEFPRPKKSESLYNLFHEILAIADSSKVGNLDKYELGDLRFSVRDCQRIALLSQTLHHSVFAEFFGLMGEITLSTSSSKKGWFSELFVTQRKISSKMATQTQRMDMPQRPKRSFFGGLKQGGGEQNE